MRNLLLINTSINGEQGNSNKLATEFVEQLATSTALKVTERDLSEQVIAHLGAQEMATWMTPAEERTAEQQKLAAVSDQLIEEVQNADILVIGMPMYNFGVPSHFKAWIDRIARAGITFKYTEQGPVGLLQDKKAIIVAARGGMYAGTAKDTQSQYLKDVFAFIGITDIEFIYAEGLNMPLKEQNMLQARREIVATIERLSV